MLHLLIITESFSLFVAQRHQNLNSPPSGQGPASPAPCNCPPFPRTLPLTEEEADEYQEHSCPAEGPVLGAGPHGRLPDGLFSCSGNRRGEEVRKEDKLDQGALHTLPHFKGRASKLLLGRQPTSLEKAIQLFHPLPALTVPHMVDK